MNLAENQCILNSFSLHGVVFVSQSHANLFIDQVKHYCIVRNMMDTILMEGFRQQDELNALLDKIPSLESRLVLRTPLEAPLHELEPTHLDLLQTALNAPSIQALFDRTQLTDLEAAEIIATLIKRGYLMAAP